MINNPDRFLINPEKSATLKLHPYKILVNKEKKLNWLL